MEGYTIRSSWQDAREILKSEEENRRDYLEEKNAHILIYQYVSRIAKYDKEDSESL